jgi:hypothetical protein
MCRFGILACSSACGAKSHVLAKDWGGGLDGERIRERDCRYSIHNVSFVVVENG